MTLTQYFKIQYSVALNCMFRQRKNKSLARIGLVWTGVKTDPAVLTDVIFQSYQQP